MGNKYRLGRKIGSGSFGDIYLGECESLSQSWFSQLHHCFGVVFLAFWYLWAPCKVGRGKEEKKLMEYCWWLLLFSWQRKGDELSFALPQTEDTVVVDQTDLDFDCLGHICHTPYSSVLTSLS